MSHQARNSCQLLKARTEAKTGFSPKSPGPFLTVTTRGPSDTLRAIDRSHRQQQHSFQVCVSFLLWLSKCQFILSPSSHNLRQWITQSKLEIVILKWCKKLKIMKNIWVQTPGNVGCLIPRFFVGKKGDQDRVCIRNSCSTPHMSPQPPVHSHPGGHLLTGTITKQSLRWKWGDVSIFFQSPIGSGYCLKLKYIFGNKWGNPKVFRGIALICVIQPPKNNRTIQEGTKDRFSH